MQFYLFDQKWLLKGLLLDKYLVVFDNFEESLTSVQCAV